MDRSSDPAEPSRNYRRRTSVGAAGESAVCEFLVAAGWQILARNLRCGRGEIDIVARDADTLVICEVKTLRACAVALATPLESLGWKKRRSIRRTTCAWLSGRPATDRLGHPVGRPPPTCELRFDAFSVTLAEQSGRAEIEHVRGAF